MKDSEHIKLLKNKNDEAFKLLIDLYGDNIHNTVLGIVQNTEDAEDLTQEVFIEVYQSVGRFKEESKLSTWIYRIAVNVSLEFLRKKSRKKYFVIFKRNADGDHPAANIPDFIHPGVLLENKERSSILFKAIGNLPGKQKVAFLLNKTEGLSYEEISAVMQLSVSSVESLLFRAKQNLKQSLSDYYKNNEW